MNSSAPDRTGRRKPPLDFDEAPELTAEMLARARPAGEVHGPDRAETMLRKRGRPAKAPEDRKQQVTLRLSPDVLAALRETGEGWQTRVDNLLAAVFENALPPSALKSAARLERLELAIAAVQVGDGEIEVSNDSSAGDAAMRRAGEQAVAAAEQASSLFERMASLSRDASTGQFTKPVAKPAVRRKKPA